MLEAKKYFEETHCSFVCVIYAPPKRGTFNSIRSTFGADSALPMVGRQTNSFRTAFFFIYFFHFRHMLHVRRVKVTLPFPFKGGGLRSSVPHGKLT